MMAEIQLLANAAGLRRYATEDELATAVGDLVTKALSMKLTPYEISIRYGLDFETTAEYEVILWVRRRF